MLLFSRWAPKTYALHSACAVQFFLVPLSTAAPMFTEKLQQLQCKDPSEQHSVQHESLQHGRKGQLEQIVCNSGFVFMCSVILI